MPARVDDHQGAPLPANVAQRMVAIVFHRRLHEIRQARTMLVIVGAKSIIFDIEMCQPAIHSYGTGIEVISKLKRVPKIAGLNSA